MTKEHEEQILLQKARVALDDLRVHYNEGWRECTEHDRHKSFTLANKSGRVTACVAILRGVLRN